MYLFFIFMHAYVFSMKLYKCKREATKLGNLAQFSLAKHFSISFNLIVSWDTAKLAYIYIYVLYFGPFHLLTKWMGDAIYFLTFKETNLMMRSSDDLTIFKIWRSSFFHSTWMQTQLNMNDKTFFHILIWYDACWNT